MTLDEIWATFERAYLTAPRMSMLVGRRHALAVVFRKHVQPMLDAAFNEGSKQRGLSERGGFYDYCTASEYAEKVISQIINERSNEEERRA